jgi:hypothetical protein
MHFKITARLRCETLSEHIIGFQVPESASLQQTHDLIGTDKEQSGALTRATQRRLREQTATLRFMVDGQYRLL